jgi:ABC-type sugar transport system substrate-binding protein
MINSAKFRGLYSAKTAVLFLLAVVLSGQCSYAIPAEKIKVSYLSPALTMQFWQNTYDVMQAAADDLDIELTAVFNESNYRLTRSGLQLLDAKEKPDYFITGFWRNLTDRMLIEAEKQQIKSLIINGAVPEAEKDAVGRPRGKFQHWIGHLYPDDEGGSYLLSRYLLEQSRNRKNNNTGEPIKVIGLSADTEMPASISRNHGFYRALKESGATDLLEFVGCGWNRDVGRKMTLEYLDAHPTVDVIWTASDAIALGAISAIDSAGLKPGKDIVVGGFDWLPETLQKIKNGEMSASMGGHFLEGAFALILIHDYQHGIDFTDDPGIEHQTSMHMITAENVDRYLQLLSNPDWDRVDFKQFSKVYNKSLKKYDFSFEAIAKQLMQAAHESTSD